MPHPTNMTCNALICRKHQHFLEDKLASASKATTGMYIYSFEHEDIPQEWHTGNRTSRSLYRSYDHHFSYHSRKDSVVLIRSYPEGLQKACSNHRIINAGLPTPPSNPSTCDGQLECLVPEESDKTIPSQFHAPNHRRDYRLTGYENNVERRSLRVAKFPEKYKSKLKPDLLNQDE